MSLSPKIIVMAILIIVLLFTMIFSAMYYLTKQKKIPENQKFQKLNKRFRFYYDFALTRKLFRKIHTQISSLAVYNFLEARIITVQFFERSLRSAVLLFVIGFIGLGDIISGFVLMLLAVVMINSTINKRIDSVNFATLKATSQLLLSMRECYTRVRNVPDAINDAKVPPILQRTVNNIYLITTANDAETRLQRFYEECPNRIIRTLATTCYIRADTGEEDPTRSAFKEGLGLIKDEVDMEVRRQINQNLMFKSLDILPFVPLFLYPPIQIFYVKMISATAAVFASGTGYLIKLAVIMSCLISYYILTTINNASVARTDDRIQFITELMYHDKVVKFAHSLLPRNFSKRMNLQKKLNGCISSKNLEYFYLEKYVFGVVVCICAIIFSVIITISARHSVYNSLYSDTMSVQLKYTAEQEAATLKYDHEILDSGELPSVEERTKFFEHTFPKASSMEIETHVQRVEQKLKSYEAMRFHWWYAFIYIAVSIAGFYVPDLLLHLRSKLVKAEAELDVLQLQTVIAILMDTNLDTLSVIYWLAKSSDIHKDILTFCYHEYVRDPLMALTRLKGQSAIPEFSSMCDKLITTIHQVTIAEAFEDLVAERNNTMKVREVVQLSALKAKRNLAGPVATAPMMVWMVTVFILPLGIVAVRSAVSMIGNLNI